MQEAIRFAGGAAALSREIGISSQAISQWNVVPAARVMAVVKAAGGKISVNQLRPDIFGERPAA
ncbi:MULTISPECIES: transcriptional regulator [Halomonas]|uniref:transcriptional regulator n=1 Tax=Halomonas TaxID=2745 RepID=UPI001C94AD72|nr:MULTISPECIES: Cro/CI family transcriptional regulator [Halomonas]MBY6209062.1 helix-turn-helix domain-containing protein [Halomonas sp. DP3Y7-2]MBY6229217.1 helix-turn-helix domain-containing protein [Halomonas sp. DP3Y7-1]MCA0917720.1 helix-turn-helix domain-containing protein [Halomonas denitrificans]